MKSEKFQKGVSIYIALMVMFILLGMTLGLTAILINQLRMYVEMEKSVVAFFAADTGMERFYYEIVSSGGQVQSEYTGQVGEASYTVEFYCGSQLLDCPVSQTTTCGDYFCVRSVGTYKDVQRSIEIIN